MRLQHKLELTPERDGIMFYLWKSGLDTADIAERLGLHEWQVANRLLHLREGRAA